MSRNSLQARKNNYNPVNTPVRRPYYVNNINSVKQHKKSGIIKVPTKGITTFESIWSAYTDKQLRRFNFAKDQNDRIMPLNLYQKFNQNLGSNTKSLKEIRNGRSKGKQVRSK